MCVSWKILLMCFIRNARSAISNTGISGNNILDLKRRWQTDLLDLRPDWVSICIGINDVWRQFDSPALKEQHVEPEVYEETYRELIERTLPQVKGIILMTPYYIEAQREDPMRRRMDTYAGITKKLAAEYGLICVDLLKAFDDFLEFRHSSFLAWEPRASESGRLLFDGNGIPPSDGF